MGTIGILLLFGWNYTRQVCLLDVDSLGRVVMEALGEGETFNKRFKKIVGSTWSEEREAGPSDSVAASPEHKSGFNLQQNLKKWQTRNLDQSWKKNKDLQWKAAHKKTMCL